LAQRTTATLGGVIEDEPHAVLPGVQIRLVNEGTSRPLPAYMQPILPLLNLSVPTEYYAILGLGSKFPIYGPPPGFVQRLGAAPTDFFLRRTYVANGVRIGPLERC